MSAYRELRNLQQQSQEDVNEVWWQIQSSAAAHGHVICFILTNTCLQGTDPKNSQQIYETLLSSKVTKELTIVR